METISIQCNADSPGGPALLPMSMFFDKWNNPDPCLEAEQARQREIQEEWHSLKSQMMPNEKALKALRDQIGSVSGPESEQS